MPRRFPDNHRHRGGVNGHYGRRIAVAARHQPPQPPRQTRLHPAQQASLAVGYHHAIAADRQRRRVARADRRQAVRRPGPAQGYGARLPAILNEQRRRRRPRRNCAPAAAWPPRRAAGLQLFQTRQVLAGNDIGGAAPAQIIKRRPRRPVIAQLHQRLGQPVGGLAILGMQLQNGAVHRRRPLPVPVQRQAHGLLAQLDAKAARRTRVGGRRVVLYSRR